MTTKIVNLFEDAAPEQPDLKPIEFSEALASPTLCTDVEEWDNVALLGDVYMDPEYSYILVWDDDKPDKKVVFRGHWNDGVIG